jgi:hypothetical protein
VVLGSCSVTAADELRWAPYVMVRRNYCVVQANVPATSVIGMWSVVHSQCYGTIWKPCLIKLLLKVNAMTYAELDRQRVPGIADLLSMLVGGRLANSSWAQNY